MHHLPKQELDELRDTLIAEKATLESELSEHGKKVNGDWQGTAQGFTGKQSDEMDAGDVMEELAINIPLVETLEARLKDVVDALARIKTGNYGQDENTGKPIPIARLRANPAARVNVE
jgi:DnaK suppressor protein